MVPAAADGSPELNGIPVEDAPALLHPIQFKPEVPTTPGKRNDIRRRIDFSAKKEVPVAVVKPCIAPPPEETEETEETLPPFEYYEDEDDAQYSPTSDAEYDEEDAIWLD